MPQPSQLIFFPWTRCIAKVRRVAQALDIKATERAQKAYWAETVHGIESTLARLGASDEEIARQVEQFGQAVTAELCRRAS